MLPGVNASRTLLPSVPAGQGPRIDNEALGRMMRSLGIWVMEGDVDLGERMRAQGEILTALGVDRAAKNIAVVYSGEDAGGLIGAMGKFGISINLVRNADEISPPAFDEAAVEPPPPAYDEPANLQNALEISPRLPSGVARIPEAVAPPNLNVSPGANDPGNPVPPEGAAPQAEALAQLIPPAPGNAAQLLAEAPPASQLEEIPPPPAEEQPPQGAEAPIAPWRRAMSARSPQHKPLKSVADILMYGSVDQMNERLTQLLSRPSAAAEAALTLEPGLIELDRQENRERYEAVLKCYVARIASSTELKFDDRRKVLASLSGVLDAAMPIHMPSLMSLILLNILKSDAQPDEKEPLVSAVFGKNSDLVLKHVTYLNTGLSRLGMVGMDPAMFRAIEDEKSITAKVLKLLQSKRGVVLVEPTAQQKSQLKSADLRAERVLPQGMMLCSANQLISDLSHFDGEVNRRKYYQVRIGDLKERPVLYF